jgi:hypothetical protein
MISGEKKKRARSVCCFNIYKMIRQIILCTSATREQTRAKNMEKVMKSRERIGQGGFFFKNFHLVTTTCVGIVILIVFWFQTILDIQSVRNVYTQACVVQGWGQI